MEIHNGSSEYAPLADVYELEGYILIRLAVPGALEEDIDVSFGPGELVIRGEIEEPPPLAAARPILREWRYGLFERSIRLPCEVDSDGLRVSLEAGVLELRLPKKGR